MDYTSCGTSGEFLAGDTLHSLGAPVCAHVGEHLSAAGEEVSEEHSDTIAGIILSSNDECLTDTVPVERSVHESLGVVAVGFPVGPLTLSLESCGYSVVTESLLLETEFAETGVAFHEVAHDECHLNDELPVGIFLLTGLALLRTVLEVLTLAGLAVLLGSLHSAGILLVIVDPFLHTAEDLGLVDALIAHAEIFLEEIGVND